MKKVYLQKYIDFHANRKNLYSRSRTVQSLRRNQLIVPVTGYPKLLSGCQSGFGSFVTWVFFYFHRLVSCFRENSSARGSRRRRKSNKEESKNSLKIVVPLRKKVQVVVLLKCFAIFLFNFLLVLRLCQKIVYFS